MIPYAHHIVSQPIQELYHGAALSTFIIYLCSESPGHQISEINQHDVFIFDPQLVDIETQGFHAPNEPLSILQLEFIRLEDAMNIVRVEESYRFGMKGAGQSQTKT